MVKRNISKSIKNIICENLSYSVGDRNLDTKILFKNLSVSFCNEKTGLVGSNGTGKTTLLKLIMGQLIPQAGKIYVNCKVGYLPQNFIANQSGQDVQEQAIAQENFIVEQDSQDVKDDQNKTLAQIFGVDQKIVALDKINSGQASQEDFDIIPFAA